MPLSLLAKLLLGKKIAEKAVDTKKKDREKRKNRLREMYVNPLGLKRVVIDGKEYLVRDILAIEKDRIVVEDIDGTIKVIKRRRVEHYSEGIEEQAEL